MVRPSEMDPLNAFVAVCLGVPLSVTFAVKEKAPAVVGVPVIAPVAELRDRFAGKAPAANDHVYGAVPFWAVKVAE